MSLLVHPTVTQNKTKALGKTVIRQLLTNSKVIIQEKELFSIDLQGNTLTEHLRVNGVSCGPLGLGLIAHHLLTNTPMENGNYQFRDIKEFLIDKKYMDADQAQNLWRSCDGVSAVYAWKEFHNRHSDIGVRCALAWGSLATKGYFRFEDFS